MRAVPRRPLNSAPAGVRRPPKTGSWHPCMRSRSCPTSPIIGRSLPPSQLMESCPEGQISGRQGKGKLYLQYDRTVSASAPPSSPYLRQITNIILFPLPDRHIVGCIPIVRHPPPQASACGYPPPLGTREPRFWVQIPHPCLPGYLASWEPAWNPIWRHCATGFRSPSPPILPERARRLWRRLLRPCAAPLTRCTRYIGGTYRSRRGTPSYTNMPASLLLTGHEKSPTRSCDVSGGSCNIDDTTTVIRTKYSRSQTVIRAGGYGSTVGPFNLGFPLQQQISS